MVEAQKEYSNRAQDGDKNSKRASEWISQTLGFNKGGLEVSRAATEDGDVLLTTSTRNLNLKEGAATVVSKLGFDFVIGAISSLHKPFDAVVDSVLGSTLTSTGFVTFTDLVTLTCAVRAPLSHEAGVLHARNAPDPRDIVWENAHVNETFMIHREWMANALLGVGAILWSVPVTAIQAMANLSQLARIPGLTWVSKAAHGDFGAFLNGYLPVLALIILITVLPFIFEWIALKYEQRKKQSDVQHAILKRFFNYQLANVYITVTAGSILDSLAEILDHPSNLLSLLAKSVPTVVGYFVMFVSTKLLAGLPVSLLQVGPLLNRIMSLMFCRDRILTQRELDEAYAPLPFELGREYANQLLIIVIMFTYATISPVILPVGAMYFLGALLVYKKQLLLVFSPAYESGGMMFPTSCQRTLIGLICGQLTLLGYTVLRRGFYQPMVLLPLPFYTLSMMNSFKKLYEEPGRYLSLERAIHLDQKSAKEAQFDRNVYRQPSMREGDLEPQPYRRKKGSSHVSEDVILEPSADKAV